MIVFNYVSFKNLLSVGDVPVKIILDRSPTTMITGKNGNGKSTVLDAMTVALFGKSYRGINKDKLVNSINKKDCVTEMQLTTGKDVWLIRRGIKPNILEIYKNGTLLDAQATLGDQQMYIETYILGFNYKSFCQTCILGASNFVPFMSMPAGQRREFIETLFGINVFSSMNSILKATISDWKTSVEKNKNQLEAEKSKYIMQKNFIDTLSNNNSALIEAKKEKLEDLKKKAVAVLAKKNDLLKSYSEKYDYEFDTLQSLKNILKAEYSSAIEHQNSISLMINTHNSAINSLNTKLKSVKKLTADSECPTCFQSIESSHIEKCSSKIDDDIAEEQAKANSFKDAADAANAKVKQLQMSIEDVDSGIQSISSYDSSILNIKNSAKEIIDEIANLSSQTSNTTLVEEQTKLAEIRAVIENLIKDKKDLLSKEEPYKIASNLLKDTGIKSLVVKQYLPILNSRVNYYLNKMNFGVVFTLDETFSEKIVSRNKTEFSYENFSAGERQRIDLALIFAWRDIASLKNSVNCNLLFLDEIGDSSLDANGVEDLMSILEELKNTNVFIVSHRGNFEEKMRSIVTIDKINGFSKII